MIPETSAYGNTFLDKLSCISPNVWIEPHRERDHLVKKWENEEIHTWGWSALHVAWGIAYKKVRINGWIEGVGFESLVYQGE